MYSLGLVTWRFTPVSADDKEWQELLMPSGKRRKLSPAWGAVHYNVADRWLLLEPFGVPTPAWDLQHAATPCLLEEELGNCRVEREDGSLCIVSEVLAQHERLQVAVIHQSWDDTRRCYEYGLPHPIRTVVLRSTVPWSEFVFNIPDTHLVERWKRDAGAQQASAGTRKRKAGQTQSYEDLVLDMPAARVAEQALRDGNTATRGQDPLRLIRGVFFSNFLKRQRDFSAAMGAAHAFDHSDAESGDRDASKDPGGETLRRTLSRLDVLDCLLWRREFRASRIKDSLLAVNLYTDSSPVGGHELQGLVMDAHWREGALARIILPGASLQYGLFDGTNKTIGLLHAMWLLSGPLYVDVWYLCCACVSVTTDMGVESATLCMPNMVRAYCQYMSGTAFSQLGSFVDRSSRWLPHALRISGWSHVWGNLSKEIAHKYPRWPETLENMRALVGFWRGDTWRQHCKKVLRRTHAEDVDLKALDNTCRTMAKWRYETIDQAMSDLLCLRIVCEKHVCADWFADAQDREQLKEVLDACSDHQLWRFMAVAKKGSVRPDGGGASLGYGVCPRKVQGALRRREKNI